MTTEERLSAVENLQAHTDELLERVVENQESLIGLVKQNTQMIEEIHRDNRQTSRIWIAIARKQNLFDDDEFRDVFGDDED